MSKGNRGRRKALGLLPTREKCKARNRRGEPCGNYPVAGAVVCATHGGSAPQVKRKAAERIAMAQDDAASLLVQFMSSKKVPFSERRRCAEFLLTFESRNEFRLTIAKWQENLDELIVDYDDIVDADVVEDAAIAADAYEDEGQPLERRFPEGERLTVPRDPDAPPRYTNPTP